MASPLVNSSFSLFLIFVVFGLPVLGNTMAWAFCRLTGCPVEKVTMFCGPKLVSFHVLGTPFSIGCLPWGGGVAFEIPAFDLKPRLPRLAAFLFTPMAFVVIAMLLLGPERALHHLTTGFSQLAAGAFHPRSTALDLIARIQAVHQVSLSAAVGISMTKLVCSLFQPGASLLTFQCLFIALGISRDHPTAVVVMTINAIAGFCVMLLWAVALVSYVWQPVV